MRAIDTSVLVRLIARDDARQPASAEDFTVNGAWISLVVLAESISVLSTVYDLGPKQLAHAIEMLLNHRSLVLQDSDAVGAALDLFLEKPSLGFSDCLVLQIARKAGHLPFGTFDRKLGRAAGAQRL